MDKAADRAAEAKLALVMENVNQTINVTGMTCENCVRHVTEALLEIDGVESAQVDLPSGTAAVTSDRSIERDQFARALHEAGYTLT